MQFNTAGLGWHSAELPRARPRTGIRRRRSYARNVSIPVRIEDLAQALAEYDTSYLLTNHSGRTKVVTVEPTVSGDRILAHGVGHGSSANLAENPQCTLLFPPAERHGYTLLIDGTGTVTEGILAMEPTTAVRHRPAAHADGPPALGAAADCVNDCLPIS